MNKPCQVCGKPVRNDYPLCPECSTKETDCWDCCHAVVKYYPSTRWEPEDYELMGCKEGEKPDTHWICSKFEKGEPQDSDEELLDQIAEERVHRED